MVARPTELPKWATDGGADVTTPSAPQQEAGYDTPNPRRGYANWLALRTYEMLEWLEQALRPTDLELADGPLPGGTAPTTSPAGLGSAASVFSGRAIINGDPIGGRGVIASPLYTYTASRDTYWDLSDAAGWTAVVVANGAGEPAVTADSVRFYKVVTNATDKTSVVDYRPSYIRHAAADFVGGVRRYWDASLATGTTIATQAELAEAHETIISGDLGTSPQSYETIRAFRARPSASIIDIFESLTEEDGAVQIVRTQGIRVNPASSSNKWLADQATGYMEFNHVGRRTVWRIDGLTPTNAYSDAALIALDPVLVEDLFHGLRFEGSTDSTGDSNPAAHIEAVRTTGLTYTPIRIDRTAGDEAIVEYVAANVLGTGITGFARAINATWSEASGLWSRTIAGEAWVEIMGPTGRKIYYHASGGSATWADTVAAGTWVLVASELSTGTAVTAGISAASFLPTTAGASPTKGALHTQNVARVVGEVVTDGAAGIVFNGFGVASITIVGANLYARLTFDHPMTGTDYSTFVSCKAYDSSDYQQNAAYVDVGIADGVTGTPKTLHNAVRSFSVSVFGDQA